MGQQRIARLSVSSANALRLWHRWPLFFTWWMVVATLPNTTHQRKVIDAQRRRLEVLEVQAAELGTATPAHVAIEIEELQLKLAGKDEPPISESDRYQAVMRAVMLLSQQVAAVEVKVERLYWLLPIILFLYLFITYALDHLP